MPEPGPRIAALGAAVEAARGHLDEGLLADAALTVERAEGRLRLPPEHTIVAIAGSTGSGKSTTFNLLAGAGLSVSGAQRPTTSEATALVWSDGDVGEILDWLGVPAARQHRRDDLDPRPPRNRLPEGLVLLDLPDHDSVEKAHHREAERVVALADLLIWVVDPQKYADAAIHRRFLQPLAGHRDVTMVVLNHLDTIPEDRRPAMLRDLRRVLVADGIRDPRILGMSAREGLGTAELRTAVRRRVEERPNVSLRVEADVRTAARGLLDAAGDAPREPARGVGRRPGAPGRRRGGGARRGRPGPALRRRRGPGRPGGPAGGRHRRARLRRPDLRRPDRGVGCAAAGRRDARSGRDRRPAGCRVGGAALPRRGRGRRARPRPGAVGLPGGSGAQRAAAARVGSRGGAVGGVRRGRARGAPRRATGGRPGSGTPRCGGRGRLPGGDRPGAARPGGGSGAGRVSRRTVASGGRSTARPCDLSRYSADL
ncbi:ABC transporter [Nocardioides sp. W3-2-3]|uniref:GTPase n=1 Tax=Nocardioides convexus TaxID=2712224 RepID=UPI0024181D1C|nr:GTPase [Nocardioides convexus]NHA01029.1 ABC transporter [Nocardioides convexus]